MPEDNKLIHVQQPNKILELLNNPPAKVWAADYTVIIWLDALKREAGKL